MDKKSIATYIILAINVVVFAWLAIQQQSFMMNSTLDSLAIVSAGANVNPLTLGGQPWRLITSMFLHYGIIHLAVNMFALYSLGTLLEPAVGTVRFVLIYFFCGVVAGIASLLFSLFIASAGASGAIFGLYGYQLGAALISSFDDKQRLRSVLVNFGVFLAINTIITFGVNVDVWGHIGGCVGGLFIALLHFKFRFLIKNAYLAIVLVVAFLSIFVLPRYQVRYYDLFQRVIKAERKKNQFFRSQLSDAQLLDSLKVVNAEWQSVDSAIRVLGRIPTALQKDTATLRQYVGLYHRETSYRIAMIERESYVYLDSLEDISQRFDSLGGFNHVPNFNPVIPNEPTEPDTTNQPALQPRRIFYDLNWKETDDPSAATFYRDGLIDSVGRWQGAVRDHYRDGKIQMKGSYKDDMKNGVFLYYTQRGTYSSAGRYEKDESVGKWEEYYWNGRLKSEIYTTDRTYVRSVWDSLGRAQVVSGNGKSISWYPNGQIAEEGSYLNGRREGDWFGYHPNGTPYFREAYRDNRLIKGVSFDEQGKRYVYDELSLYAYPVNGMEAFKKFVAENIRKPSDTFERRGIVKVVFNVGDDGSLWDFVVIDGMTPSYNEEAIRLIQQGPAWRPGLLHGHVKRPSQGYAEIVFD